VQVKCQVVHHATADCYEVNPGNVVSHKKSLNVNIAQKPL